MGMNLGKQFQDLARSATSIFEGMAVTFSHLFREPVTIQYPDRTDRPVRDMLPARYRGFLEVQMDICGACKRCEKVCPVDCIRVEMSRDPATKQNLITRFDIDLSKCMFCGLCVEACEDGATGAIRHTREFEGAAGSLDALIFRYVEPGKPWPLYKTPKDKSTIPVGEIGPHAIEARERALRDNLGLFKKLRDDAKAKAEAPSGT